MKEIPNKSTTIASGRPDGSMMTFSDLILQACDCMPPGGFSPSVHRARARLDKAMGGLSAGDMIKLEDADFEVAQGVIRDSRWINRHSDYIALYDAFGV